MHMRRAPPWIGATTDRPAPPDDKEAIAIDGASAGGHFLQGHAQGSQIAFGGCDHRRLLHAQNYPYTLCAAR